MNEREIADAVAEFFAEEVGIETTYGYPIANATGPLPDAVVSIAEKRVTRELPEIFDGLDLQQSFVRLFTAEISIMVGVEQTEAAADAADETLRGYGEATEEAVWEDLSLGGRVPICAPEMVFDYSTPFIRREDGTTGRFAVFTLQIAEPIGYPA